MIQHNSSLKGVIYSVFAPLEIQKPTKKNTILSFHFPYTMLSLVDAGGD